MSDAVAISLAESEAPAIRIDGLVKTYRLYQSAAQMALDRLGIYSLLPWLQPRFTEFDALRGLNLEIARGERIGVIGRNGAGKTTLLKLVTGNFPPSAGTVAVNGSVQALMQIGLGFHPDFTGFENIRSGLLANGLTGADLDQAIQDVVDFVELGEFLHQPVSTYSLGMKSRLQFATATAIKPDILIVDEILGAGDAYFSGKSAHRMRRLTSSGCTLMLVSHSMEQILQFCDRAVWIDQGCVKADGPALEVVRSYEEFIANQARQVALGESAATAPADRETPEWQREAMAELMVPTSGEAVSRWEGEPGLRIVEVRVLGPDGQPLAQVYQGEPLRLSIRVTVSTDEALPLRFGVLLMTLTGTPVSRLLSPYFSISESSVGDRTFELTVPHNILVAQEIMFSVAAFKFYEPERPGHAVRFDLLSRSFQFRVIGGVPNDPGLVTMSANWREVATDA